MKSNVKTIIFVSILASLTLATALGSHSQEEVGGRQVSIVTHDNETLVSPVLWRMGNSIGLLTLAKQAKTSRGWYEDPAKRGWPLYGPWVVFPYDPATGTFSEGKQILNDLAASLFGQGSGQDPKYRFAAGGLESPLYLVSEVPIDGPPSDIALAELGATSAADSIVLKGRRIFKRNELRGGREEPGLSYFLDSPDLLILPSGRMLLAGSSNEASLWLTRSDDGGETWHDLQLLGPRFRSGISPVLLQTTQGLALLYIDETNRPSRAERESKAYHKLFRNLHKAPGPIALVRSADGTSWETALKGIAGTQDVDSFAACTGLCNRIFVVYSRRDANGGCLYLTISSDNGKTWSKATQLTAGTSLDFSPSVIVDGDSLIVSFSRIDADGKQRVCYITVPIEQ